MSENENMDLATIGQDSLAYYQWFLKKYAQEVPNKDQIIAQAKKDGSKMGDFYRMCNPKRKDMPDELYIHSLGKILEAYNLLPGQARLYARHYRTAFEQAWYGEDFPQAVFSVEVSACRNAGYNNKYVKCECEKCTGVAGMVIKREGKALAWLAFNEPSNTYSGLIKVWVGTEQQVFTVFRDVKAYPTAREKLIQAVNEFYCLIYPEEHKNRESLQMPQSAKEKVLHNVMEELTGDEFCEVCYDENHTINQAIVYKIDLKLDLSEPHGENKTRRAYLCGTHGNQVWRWNMGYPRYIRNGLQGNPITRRKVS